MTTEFQIIPIGKVVESKINPRRRGSLIFSIRSAIEQIGAGVEFTLADVVSRMPAECDDHRQAIASLIVKMSQREALRIERRSRGARRSSIYAWPGSWPSGLSVEERFWALVEKTDGCWRWKGAPDENGYGRFTIARRTVILAHRASYQLNVGPVADDICVLHHCDNPSCVRPDHLFLGDRGDNARDMAAKGRQWLQQHPERVSGENHWTRRRKKENAA